MSNVMNELIAYDIYPEEQMPKVIAITDLLKKEKCLAFLKQQQIDMTAPNLAVTASMLAKRYAHLVVSSTLFHMAELNRAPQLRLETCGLSKDRKLCIQPHLTWDEAKDMEREVWREKVLHLLFASHITPVVEVLRKTTRLSSAILWENVAIRINSTYRKLLANQSDPVKVDRIISDFQFLKLAHGNLFHLDQNPIKRYLKIGEELQANPWRKTCCLYCKLAEDAEGIGYCSNCPKRKQKNGEAYS